MKKLRIEAPKADIGGIVHVDKKSSHCDQVIAALQSGLEEYGGTGISHAQ